MSALPPRDNRVLQAVDLLKEEIGAGRLAGPLPGQRELAKRIRVSRVTLQKALSLLEQDGWVSPSKPRCRRVILIDHASHLGQDHQCHGKTIVTLAPLKMAEMPATVRLDHSHLNSYCSEVGIRLMHRVLDVAHLKRPSHRLKEFVKQNPADLYLLLLSSKETQEWFGRTQTPCIVLGTAWPHCKLSSADWDQHALGLHAGGVLTRMGHTRVGMIYPDPSKHGIELFVEGLKKASPDMHLTLARQDDAPESILRALISLVQNSKGRPTAIILPRVFYVMVAISALPSMGLKIPENISILCLVYDETFRYFHPNVAAYRVAAYAYPKAIFKLAVDKLMHPDTETNENAMVMPDFISAASLERNIES